MSTNPLGIDNSEADTGFIEDSFTSTRPPQRNSSNEHPTRALSDAGEGHSTSGHTQSTLTVCDGETIQVSTPMPNAVALGTHSHSHSPAIRPHISYVASFDYQNAEQRLTEDAKAAHDHHCFSGLGYSNIEGWLGGQPRFLQADPTNLSICRHPRTQTVAGTGTGSGSSWTIVSAQASLTPQMADMGETLYAVGGQFEEATYSPDPIISDEGLV
ncbi:hypothetical protein ONZ43_g6069 [Nemania bipapillata]|uniref:Uncharacterized protein n=1 Tax=Nemania bipapillata TaxID=110536 RepID=A0ACC2I2W5_9PEZI|nr:hypothetical protein ONZ43_g6069 [Nemania bipapillata]